MPIASLKIRSQFGDYEVSIVESLGALIGDLQAHDFKGLMIDRYIDEELLGESSFFPDLPRIRIEANESAKQYSAIESIYVWMAENQFDRKSHLLVVGGGSIQDIATFTAATFHRGLKWTFVPTTLLSQADSCIGGKCGINLQSYKNQVGLVYPPSRIVANSGFLAHLKQADLISGMGEILKISVTGRDNFWSDYKDLVRNRSIPEYPYSQLINLALRAKRYVIEVDEMELDFRRVLNYGHTLGHAIEAASDFAIPHGIGVILGIKAVTLLGQQWGITPKQLGDDIVKHADQLLSGYQGPLDFHVDTAIRMLKHDKKTANGLVTFVVLKEVGTHEFVQKSLDNEMFGQLSSVLYGL